MKNVYTDLRLPSPNEERETLMNAMKEKNRNANLRMNKKNSNSRKSPKIVDKYLIQLAGTDLCIESEFEISYKGSKLLLQKCSKIRRQVLNLRYATIYEVNVLCLSVVVSDGEK